METCILGSTARNVLFLSMKHAGHAKHSLIMMRWPVYITNRVVFAVAGLWRGGKGSHTLPASVPRRGQTSWKSGTRPRTTKSKAGADHLPVFSCDSGTPKTRSEFSVRAMALNAWPNAVPSFKPHEAHEEDEHACPVQYCIDLFEEHNAVWVEAVREARRKLCARLGTENPRLVARMVAPAFSSPESGI